MGVECKVGVEMSVGAAVGSGVVVGMAAARVCWTDRSTHIWVASAPISGVGAG